MISMLNEHNHKSLLAICSVKREYFPNPLHKGMVIIYGRGRRWKGGDIEFECKQLEGEGQNFNAQLQRGAEFESNDI